jgi:hypothetical protein
MILLIIALFANSKAKIGRNGSKKRKNLFLKCVLESPVWEASFCQKNQNRLILMKSHLQTTA